jgi:hypothetical protein
MMRGASGHTGGVQEGSNPKRRSQILELRRGICVCFPSSVFQDISFGGSATWGEPFSRRPVAGSCNDIVLAEPRASAREPVDRNLLPACVSPPSWGHRGDNRQLNWPLPRAWCAQASSQGNETVPGQTALPSTATGRAGPKSAAEIRMVDNSLNSGYTLRNCVCGKLFAMRCRKIKQIPADTMCKRQCRQHVRCSEASAPASSARY